MDAFRILSLASGQKDVLFFVDIVPHLFILLPLW